VKKKYRVLSYVFIIFLAFTFLIGFSTDQSHSEGTNFVYSIELDDATINPVTAKYITKAIDAAYASGAQCLILKLDTPGGLLTSTRTIVKKILSAKVPVVVYIYPSGSRAGSAGVFITYASHVAAMSPSTNIGAAHPVQMGQKKQKEDLWDGLGRIIKDVQDKKDEQKKSGDIKIDDVSKKITEKKDEVEKIEPDKDPMSSKILQDTVAFIKAIAKLRGRNIDWAVKSVTKSSSITENEAKELGVIEIIAKDTDELLSKLDGRVIKVEEKQIILATKNATIHPIEMDFREKFFNILANPNIAYILMILGFYGLLYEITHPGIGVPGVMGTIFLILAFFSMQTLPTNYAGLALIILAIILFIAEANVPGFGLLTLGGVVCMILGSMLLFDSPVPMMRVSLSLILSFSLTTAAITLFLVRAVITAHRAKVLSGKKGLIGEKGEAKTQLSAKKEGKVYVHGELWNAIADEEIKKGEKVIVEEIEGMLIKVKKV